MRKLSKLLQSSKLPYARTRIRGKLVSFRSYPRFSAVLAKCDRCRCGQARMSRRYTSKEIMP